MSGVRGRKAGVSSAAGTAKRPLCLEMYLGKVNPLALKLFFDGKLVHLGREEHGMAIRVQSQRYAVVLEHLMEHVELSYDVFLRPEIQA